VGRLRERERELAAVEVLLERRDGVLVLEGRAGIGKTSLVEAACSRADELGYEVVRARGSELAAGFAFGVLRRLSERRAIRLSGLRGRCLTPAFGACQSARRVMRALWHGARAVAARPAPARASAGRSRARRRAGVRRTARARGSRYRPRGSPALATCGSRRQGAWRGSAISSADLTRRPLMEPGQQ